jgi:ferredoxin
VGIEAPGLRVEVSRHKCIASKACVNRAPGVFELDATQVSSVRDPSGEPLETVIEAAEACPTGAITVFRDGQKLA